MRLLRIIPLALLIALVASPAHAWMGPVMCGGGVAGVSSTFCTDSDCAACDYQERFECGSTDGNQELTWTTVAGSPNFGYTTTALSGSESLYLTTTAQASFDITGTDGDQYIAFQLQIPTGSGNNGIILLKNGTTNMGWLFLSWASGTSNWKSTLYYNAGSSNSGATADPYINQNTTYYVKIRYNNGSGSDGVWTVWTSTDGSTWTQRHSVTNAPETAQITRIQFNRTLVDAIIIDDVRTDTADINW